jgi:hypothetical protein
MPYAVRIRTLSKEANNQHLYVIEGLTGKRWYHVVNILIMFCVYTIQSNYRTNIIDILFIVELYLPRKTFFKRTLKFYELRYIQT